jgi:hypothetical protein
MKTYGEERYRSSILDLNTAVYGYEWSASRLGRFKPGKEIPEPFG